MVCQIADIDRARVRDAVECCAPAGTRPEELEAQRANSEGWLLQILTEWSPCGKLAYVEGKVKGLILYLPAALFTGRSLCRAYQENPVECPASWAERGMVFVVCLWAKTEGCGIGGALLRAMLENLGRPRQFRGSPGSEVGVMVFNPTERIHWPAGPADFYRSFGFVVERSDPATGRVWLTRPVSPCRPLE